MYEMLSIDLPNNFKPSYLLPKITPSENNISQVDSNRDRLPSNVVFPWTE